jgi:hypothetical protein
MTRHINNYLWDQNHNSESIISDADLFNDKETHNVYLRLARAHKLKGTKKKRPKSPYSPPLKPSRPASSPRSNLRQSPLSGRSAKSPRTFDPTNPQFSADQDGAGANGNSAAAWSVENQALWEKNGRILYEAIGRVTNKKMV